MISLLAKWFIHEKPDTEQPQVREKYGILCSVVGICLNLLLTVGKLLAGALSGSIAITADALNNLSDIGSSLITLIGMKLAQQKPDEEHPFGHGRLEYVAGLLVSVVILLMGFELMRSSFTKILNPSPVKFSMVTAVILIASVCIKLYMALYNRRIGKAIDSAPMGAVAVDSLSDAIATTVVLVAMVVDQFIGLPIDGWCGLAVSLFILFAGLSTLKSMVDLLLGQPPSHAYIEEIKATVMAHPEVIGVHDLMVHDYGPGRRIITLHAEVSASEDMLSIHDTIDNIENELHDKLGSKALIHMDPIDTDDALTEETRGRVAEVVKGLCDDASIHDFRMVSGPTHTNLIFDVSVPYDLKVTESEIKKRVSHMVRALDNRFFAVVTVDRESEGLRK